MMQKSTLDFFKEIKENNNKPWFEQNKPRYEAAKANYLSFMKELLVEIRKIEPFFETQISRFRLVIFRDFVWTTTNGTIKRAFVYTPKIRIKFIF